MFITYSGNVFVALGIHHATRSRTVICDLSSCKMFVHIIS